MTRSTHKTITREEWRQQQDVCHNPGCRASVRVGSVLECHEIIGGPDRAKTILLPAFWLALCRRCHEQLGSRPNQKSLVRQLAVKKWADPDNYDLETVVLLYYPKCTQAYIGEIAAQVVEEYKIIAREWT